MNIFRPSKAEDVVDRCNNFWTVLFFLVLALGTWLFPLTLTQQSPSSVSSPPKYTARCWCPAQFTGSHVNYVNNFCAVSYNNIINNVTEVNNLFEPVSDIIPIHGDKQSPISPERFQTVKQSSPGPDSTSATKQMPIPFLLLLFAVVIKLPYILSGLLAGCSLNVDQTLESANHVQQLNGESKRRAIQEIAQSVTQEVKSSTCSASLVYLVVKVLCCGIIFAGLITLSARPDVTSAVSQAGTTNLTTDQNVDSRPPVDVLMCEIPITMMSNVQVYNVQCVFTQQTASARAGNGSNAHSYYGLFNGLLAYLVILFIVNILSLLVWFFRLVLRMCGVSSSAAASGAAMDVQLLLSFSHYNADPLFTKMLAESLSNPGASSDSEKAETVA